MDQYQIRGRQAWHHHMALVMMSMLFMRENRLDQKEQHALVELSRHCYAACPHSAEK
jgi:SRSO17 transposase